MAVDRIIIGDRIFGIPDRRAVAVRNGRIIGVLDDAGLQEHRGRGVEFVEIGGTILAGLTDSHAHPVLGAVLSRGVDLTRITDLPELRQVLSTERSRVGTDGWIFGWGLAHSVWGGNDPHSREIDDVTGDIPCALRMFDVHSMLVNHAALGRARIRSGRVFETGSRVAVDADGIPTGYLLELEAMALIDSAMPAENEDAVQERLSAALGRMSAAGLTGAHVMDANFNSERHYQVLEDSDSLPLRLKVHPWVEPGMNESDWNEIRASIGRGGRRWGIHGVKLFIDGTIDNGTAWLRSPDRDGASVRSTWDDLGRYRAAIGYFARHGIGTATHAIGDAAILNAAAAIGDARRRYPRARHRIEHLELTGDDVITTVRTSGAIASMQPTHCTHFVAADGTDNWSQRIGGRAREAWRSESLRRAGVPIALGSDWPIAHFNPLLIIAAARLRRPAGTRLDPVMPAEGLAIDDGIAAYTRGAAFAAGVEADEGRIAAGYRCDLTILDRDPTSIEPDELAEVRVNATVVDGDVIYAA